MVASAQQTGTLAEQNVDLPIVNIAAYLFTSLDRLPERRAELRELCERLSLKGTILLAPEGINLFMAGGRQEIDELLNFLNSDPAMSALKAKESFSDKQPFSRLLVKLKKEIISFGIEGIEPNNYGLQKISPETLRQWLDEGRPLTLLDTRNDYEVELGTFEQALPIGVDNFREFPDAVRQLPEELKEQPIVMFCTGGIRCEKAGPFMEREGFRQIYQLDGGILKYFEDCGGAHYQGDCFVFDHRVALDPDLNETSTTQCYACQHPLTLEQQQSEKYVPGESCPFCWQEPVVEGWTVESREARIREVSQPLPGSVPYTNHRPLNVPQKYHDQSLHQFLTLYHPHISAEEWQRICDAGLIHYKGRPWPGDRYVWAGQKLVRLEPDTVEPEVNADLRIVAWLEKLVVFNKPAPLPVHPCGRFNLNSMTSLLDLAFPEEKLRPAHRLDANTTGLIVFTNHRSASLRIQRQFERGQAKKTYLCRVHGAPDWEETVCELPISRGPAEHGARYIDEESGQPATTEFRVLQKFADGTSLLEARPLTGRTNQIRLHLWQLGYPIQGDTVYQQGGQIGSQQTQSVGDEPMCLHAWKLSLFDPDTQQPLSFETELPVWGKA